LVVERSSECLHLGTVHLVHAKHLHKSTTTVVPSRRDDLRHSTGVRDDHVDHRYHRRPPPDRPVMKRRRFHRSVAVGAVVIVGVAGATAQHFKLFTRNTSTPVPVAQVQRRYGESTSTSVGVTATTATQPAAGKFPEPGVYVYTTTGRDSIDAMTGAHHDYPATTTITVTTSDCGVQQRWDVLVERWEEWQRCADSEGVRETRRTNFDEFFGQSQTDTWICNGDPRPFGAPAGTAWTTLCVNGTAPETHSGVVLGAETMTVGTTTVDAVHVRVTITDDITPDHQVIDTWYLRGSDLVVAQTSTAATSNDTVLGTVHYEEMYEIHLTSLTPLT
jgi:hypothetical protein